VVTTIKRRDTYFGLHMPVRGLQADHAAITQASVVAFAQRSYAEKFARMIAMHHSSTHRWPDRVVHEEKGLLLAHCQSPLLDMAFCEPTGLQLQDETFSELVKRMSLQDVAVRLVTTLPGDDGRFQSTVYQDKVSRNEQVSFLDNLLLKQCDKV
jgi:hypothetical protein